MSTPVIAIHAVALDSPADASAFIDLLDAYARDPMGGGRPLGAEARGELVARLQGWPGFHGALAEADGRAIGLINCFTGFSTFAARPLLNVHDLVVLPAWRGRGVAQALLGWAEACARELGCCKLTLEVLSGNAAALAAYARAGFRPYRLDPAAGDARFLERPL